MDNADCLVGRRGFGSAYTHQIWGVDTSEYLNTKANEEVIVCVQIESLQAVDNLEAIAQTQGVGEWLNYRGNVFVIPDTLLFEDVLFIGPFDLSLAMGYPTPNPEPHPDVEKVIQRIKDVAHKYQKKVYVLTYSASSLLKLGMSLLPSAFYCTSGDSAKKRAEQGFDLVRTIPYSFILRGTIIN
jgi:4-hydroxy-2-oxoheptanedioate aldolase